MPRRRLAGLALDDAANAVGGPSISPAGVAASAWVVPTDENLMIARHTRRLLNSCAGQNGGSQK